MAGTPDPPFAPTEAKVSKLGKRRESGRQIKKVVKDLPDSQARAATAGKNREKMQESMKACNEILKELFSKKHSVSRHLLATCIFLSSTFIARICVCFDSQLIRIAL